MFRRLCVVLAMLAGCRSKPEIPTQPGTSLPLSYPVVLVGQGSVDVRDDAATLTSATLASGMNFRERKLIDSSGKIYEVKNATIVNNARAWWRDMGTSQQSYFLQLGVMPIGGRSRTKSCY